MKVEVSLISVNYKVKRELIACISSIVMSKPKVSYEIIVVDNEEKSEIGELLKKRYPKVKYIKSPGNIGYGAGNNLGVKHALGKFIFFINPDTVVTEDAIDTLCNFVKKNPNVGMVAPLLLNPSGKIYPSQGSDEYNLINALVVISFINKLFPNNPISRKFFHKNWNKKDVEEFDVVPGTAFIIKKSIFERARMFDEKFFLYFEEYDLAKRVKKLGYRNFIIPKAKVYHVWEASTKTRKDIGKIFSKSRYLFFKKNYGIFFSLFISLVSNFKKHELMLGLIVVLSVFLFFFKIKKLMVFIGDQGWFYLSARDMLINGNIPLVGIASSHPWLHQGALWTYLLAFFLWIFNFNPVSGAYLTILIGLLTVIAIYIVSSSIFSKRVGIISALLYATSPLAVFYMRFPYHTSPIPIFVIVLIYSLFKIMQNKFNYLPLTLFLLGVLYNFEITTAIFWVFLPGILGYKLLRKKTGFKEILNKKNLVLSTIALVIPLLPMILYDVKNGFPQTVKFIAWIFYKAVQHEFSIDKILTMFNFLFDNFKKLIFPSNNFISLVVLISIGSWVTYLLFKKKKISNSYNLVFLLFFIPLSFIILNQIPSDAYLTILFPTSILMFSLFLNFLMDIKRINVAILIVIVIIVFSNINFMFKNNFTFDKSNRMFTLDKRFKAANKILNIVGNKDYNLKGRGDGSEHESFTMNYEYLTWWLGHAPSKNYQNLKIYISESSNGIKIND